MNILIDFMIGISFVIVLHILVYVVSRENLNPIFHKDNNIDSNVDDQELIYNEYVPDPDYMDKLEYSSFDLKKYSPIPRHLNPFSSNKPDPFISAKDLKKKRKI